MKVHREFILTGPQVARALWLFCKQNAAALVEAGKPLRVTVSNDPKRNNPQNRRYWKGTIAAIAEQVFVDGRTFAPEVWHEYFANRLLPHIELRLPDGEIVRRRKSTTELTVSEFAEYIHAVESDAASEFGVMFALEAA